MEGQPPPPPPPTPAPAPPPPRSDDRRNPWPWVVAVVAVAAIGGVVAVLLLSGDTEKADAQTVQFEAPTKPGKDPFTKPADVAGKKKVKLETGGTGSSSSASAATPFGGSGSDLVCDRELLIRSLTATPERMREWARVLGVEPTVRAVTRYIRSLRPYTLVRDTRVTNHTFTNGRAVPLQSILAAGTAVLVDDDGVPVVRCRCGNPLLEPIYYPEAVCLYCPPHYTPPRPCSDYSDCYQRYPDPPPIHHRRRLHCDPPRSQADFERCRDRGLLPREEPTPEATSPPVDSPASASFSPSSGAQGTTFTLSASSYDPNTTLAITMVRPDGVVEHYSMTTDSRGNGTFTFTNTENSVPGTYTATVTGGGESAQAAARLTEGTPPSSSAPDSPPDDLQCDPPRTQLESEQCAGVD